MASPSSPIYLPGQNAVASSAVVCPDHTCPAPPARTFLACQGLVTNHPGFSWSHSPPGDGGQKTLGPGDALREVAAVDACPRFWSGSAVGQLSICLSAGACVLGNCPPAWVPVFLEPTLGLSSWPHPGPHLPLQLPPGHMAQPSRSQLPCGTDRIAAPTPHSFC